MNVWFADGTIFAVIAGITVLEAAGLIVWHRSTAGGLRPLDVIGQLAAGALLCVAAFLALSAAWWGWVGLALAMACLAHVFDLQRRLRSNKADERG